MKAINAVWMARTDLTNLNSGIGGSNLVDVKKYKFNGVDYPYVSGQAMRYYWKESIRRLISTADYCVANVKGETCGDIENCILDDLFGFMTTEKKKGAQTRVSPIKMSPAMGLLSLNDNLTIDFLTRRKPQEEVGELKGDIVNVELAVNLYKAGFSIDVVKIGSEEKIDPAKKKRGIEYGISGEKRKERLLLALNAFKNISDFSKQARVLTDFTPDIILLSVQDRYNHLLQKALELKANNYIELNTVRLGEIISDLKKSNDSIFAGLLSGVFKNEGDIKKKLEELKTTVTTPMQAIEDVYNKVNEQTFEGKK
jgi:CRISPR-associated protein Cst2